MAFQLDEGGTYTAVVTVTNQSTKGGEPWPATLKVVAQASAEGMVLLPSTQQSGDFSAGQTKSFNFTLETDYLATGTGSISGSITVDVLDPGNNVVANAVASITVNEIPIDYGAGVVIG